MKILLTPYYGRKGGWFSVHKNISLATDPVLISIIEKTPPLVAPRDNKEFTDRLGELGVSFIPPSYLVVREIPDGAKFIVVEDDDGVEEFHLIDNWYTATRENFKEAQ